MRFTWIKLIIMAFGVDLGTNFGYKIHTISVSDIILYTINYGIAYRARAFNFLIGTVSGSFVNGVINIP